MTMIRVEDLGFAYGDSHLLRDLSFTADEGSFLAIAGPNGVGKSTLLALLAGLLKPHAGRVTIDSKAIESYNAHSLASMIAFVSQQFVPNFSFTVTETVMMARTIHLGVSGFETEHDRQVVRSALEATDTMQFASRSLGQISGGERQRVFIARALAQETPIVFLDEPTSFLDLRHQVQIFDLLSRMQKEQSKTIVAVTHDVNLAGQYCDEVLLLGGDCSYHTGQAGEVFTVERIREVFGVGGFQGDVGSEKFFLPLGKFARDYRP